jgi:hypothetical protein
MNTHPVRCSCLSTWAEINVLTNDKVTKHDYQIKQLDKRLNAVESPTGLPFEYQPVLDPDKKLP